MVTIGAFGNVFELSPSDSKSTKNNRAIDKSDYKIVDDKGKVYYEGEKFVSPHYGLTIDKDIGVPFEPFNVVCTKLPSENNGYANFNVSIKGDEKIMKKLKLLFIKQKLCIRVLISLRQ